MITIIPDAAQCQSGFLLRRWQGRLFEAQSRSPVWSTKLPAIQWILLFASLLIIGSGHWLPASCASGSIKPSLSVPTAVKDTGIHVVPGAYPTIQDAVDAAQPGETVRILAGYYEESLVITSPVRILGDGRSQVILQAPDGAYRLISVAIEAGEVEISGISLVGAVHAGVDADIAAGARLIVHDCSVADPVIGINIKGAGQAMISDNLITASGGFGIALGCASSICCGNEIRRADIGILLDGRTHRIAVECSRNAIAECRIGFGSLCEECGFGSGPCSEFEIAGSANAVASSEKDLCTDAGSSTWPADFLLEASGAVLRDLIAILAALEALGDEWDSRDAAEEIYARGAALLADVPSLCLEAEIQMQTAYALLGPGWPIVEADWDREAVNYFEQARLGFVECGRIDVACTLDLTLGRLFLSLGERYCRDALLHLWQAEQASERTHCSLDPFSFYRDLGQAYLGTGRPSEALVALERALRNEPANQRGMDSAELRKAIGDACRQVGQYEDALSAYQEARDALAKDGVNCWWSAISDACMLFAEISFSEANLFSQLGMQDEARIARAEAVQYINDPHADVAYHSLATTRRYIALGAWLLTQGEYERALYYFSKSGMPFAISYMPIDQAELEVYTGLARIGLGEFGWAIDHFEEALPVFERHEMWEEVAKIEQHRGDLYTALGLEEIAIGFYRNAIELLDRVAPENNMRFSSPETRWQVLWSEGKAHEAIGEARWEEAISAYVWAATVIESIRGGFTSEDLKLAWQERTQDVYEHLIDLLYRTKQGSSALLYAERCRARTFLDLVAAGPIGTLDNIAEEGIRSGVVDASVIEVDLAEVVAGLPVDTAALEYFVTDSTTYVWVIHQGTIHGPEELPHGRVELMNEVIACREALEAREEVTEWHLIELYDWLIAPVEHLLPVSEGGDDVPCLIIVPSGPLHYVPFQALLLDTGTDDGKLSPLIERYALSYTPSLTSLMYAQATGDAVASLPSSFLGLADPDSGDVAFPRLPEAQTESRTVASLFLPAAQVFVGVQATEEMVQTCSATASQILFSTHGRFNAHSPMYSYLLLAPTEGGSDGQLYAHEIFGLSLQAETVVLSACETLLPSLQDMEDQVNRVAGRSSPGERLPLTEEQMADLTVGDEVVGLTRAFLSAGASSVLSSLWSVPSEATAQLMVSYYVNLESGMSKGRALRAAQLGVMSTSGYSEPWYWAAFNLMGDCR